MTPGQGQLHGREVGEVTLEEAGGMIGDIDKQKERDMPKPTCIKSIGITCFCDEERRRRNGEKDPQVNYPGCRCVKNSFQ